MAKPPLIFHIISLIPLISLIYLCSMLLFRHNYISKKPILPLSPLELIAFIHHEFFLPRRYDRLFAWLLLTFIIFNIFNYFTNIVTPLIYYQWLTHRNSFYRLCNKPLYDPSPNKPLYDKQTVPSPSQSPSLLFCLLPPSNKKTLFLDLDKTLISTKRTALNSYDLRFTSWTSRKTYYVTKRPGVDELFRRAVSFGFEIVIFTASHRDYTNQILNWLDPTNEFISHRLCRDSCRITTSGRVVKDLSLTGRRLDQSVIIDDKPRSFVRQLGNAIEIEPFNGDSRDVELSKLFRFFEMQRKFIDLRCAIYCYKQLHLSGKSAAYLS